MRKHLSILFLFCWFAFSFGQIGKDRLLEIEKFIQKEKYNSDLGFLVLKLALFQSTVYGALYCI